GKHVICEKPLARTSQEAKKMVAAATKARRQLFVGHCIRFWPMYSAAAEIIKSKQYGKVISAVFRRLSMTPKTPTWSWQNWLLDQKKSGSCAFDMHIHDADFILFALGKPKSVSSHTASKFKGCMDHIITAYDFGRDKLVVAEGGWEYAPGFGFEMSFNVAMEKATMVGAPDCSLTIHPLKGMSKKLKLSQADGYELELKHFIDCIAKKKTSKIISPKAAMDSVKLLEAEVKSAQTGRPVKVKL
ncbi:MAG: Gfo/Idh/MocA family oxidoreductase, partial [Planctomycetes bacterium]|nr:Gfo/Idh/MocA family oxidoreductase [Planctomycetota bacterium]